MIDMMVGALTDPFDTMHMGVTAENVATKCGITREQQDAFAVESHRRAAAAIGEGHFKSQILPIELKSKKGPVSFDTDEHVRSDATAEGMAQAAARCSPRRTAPSPPATRPGSTMRPPPSC